MSTNNLPPIIIYDIKNLLNKLEKDMEAQAFTIIKLDEIVSTQRQTIEAHKETIKHLRRE